MVPLKTSTLMHYLELHVKKMVVGRAPIQLSTETIIVESDEPNGPFGAKEVGEGAIMPTIPAILNAVYDAIGVRINELPLTPERIYMAIKEQEK